MKRVKKSKIVKKEKNPKKFMYYPELSSDNFYHDIYAKKEFNKYKIPVETRTAHQICNPTEFKLMPQQEFLRNYISVDTPYNGILVYHGVGVGKTCSAISIAERFKETMKEYGKEILVILNRNIRDNFKKQIYDVNKETDNKEISKQCTGFTYQLGEDLKYLTKEQRARKIQSIIKANYKFLGYKQFANEVQRLTGWMDGKQSSLTPEMKKLIKKRYSNRIIIIDEIHNVKQSSQESRVVPPYLMAVIRYSKNIRLILMSATPMYHDPTEIIFILNLLLVNDNRKPVTRGQIFNTDGSLKPDGAKLLSEISKGYVSYLRGERPPAFPVKLYPPIANVPTHIKYNIFGELLPENERIRYSKIVECPMSDYQYGGYRQLLDKTNLKDLNKEEDNDDNADRESSGFTVSRSLSQLSNIAFPGPNDTVKYGKYGYVKSGGIMPALIETRKTSSNSKKRAITYSFGDVALEHRGTKEEVPFVDESILKKYSDKYNTALTWIKKSNGVCYVYSEFRLAGVIPFAIMLEQNGFDRYTVKGESQLLNYTPNKVGGGGKRPRICYKCGEPASAPQHKIGNKGYHKWRVAKYILVTGSSDSSTQITIGQVADVMNSPSNKYGEDVKVIIGTRVAGEGIDFKRIRQVHILEPWYNLSRLEQVIGRGIRFCSHIDLNPEERNVDIFQYASTAPTDSSKKDQETETIDLNYYRKAEIRDIKIKTVEQVLKRSAVDCALNKHGNTIEDKGEIKMKNSIGDIVKYRYGDKPGTAGCGYRDSCEFTCEWEPPKSGVKINKDTYTLRFAQSDIDSAKKHIKFMYRSGYAYDLDAIVKYVKERIPDIEDIYIYKAISDLLNAPEQLIYDKFNQEGNLIYRGNYYVFQPLELNYKKIPMYYRMNPPPTKKKYIRLDDKEDLSKNSNNSNNTNKVEGKNIIQSTAGKMLDLEAALTGVVADNGIKEVGQLVAGMVIERLSDKCKIVLLKRLLSKVIKGEETNEYMDNMIDYFDQNILREDDIKQGGNKSKIIGFRIDDNYYCYDSVNNSWKQCDNNVIQLIQFRQKIRYKKGDKEMKMNKIYGFLDSNSKGVVQFKLFDETKATGALTLDFKKSERSSIKGRACGTESTHNLAKTIDKLGMVMTNSAKNRTGICYGIELFLRYYDMIKFDNKRWFIGMK